MDVAVLAQYLIPGATTGCVYALVALGFVLCANVSGVVNFAQGEFVMFGGILAAWMLEHTVPLAVAVPAAAVAEAQDHHPDWRNVYATVEISLSTHDAGGITQRDLQLAQEIDRLAAAHSLRSRGPSR